MTPPPDTTATFADLGVPDDLVDALAGQGIDEPFAVQSATIPPALDGKDVAGRAPTGSGKTLAFGVPLVANVQRARPKRPRALVLVPTRELAAQVSRDLGRLGAARDVRVHAFYGGTRFEPQVKALRRGVDIAVACPGRLADLVAQGIARLDGVDLVVVDEADRMADMGFLPEVQRLLDQTDAERQTLLFSATLDGDVDALVRRYQHDPVTVDVTPEVDATPLEHHFWSVPHAQRVATTAAIVERVGPTVVFTRTRHGADRVARQLHSAGVSTVAIHGNRTQQQRDRALGEFRSGAAQALVATDVAARGIHVDDVTCVVHFDLPADAKDFVHRSGRTGRAGATGVVVALAMPDRRRDNDRLFRTLELDVTVTGPDLEALPVAPPRERRPDRPFPTRARAGGGTRGTRPDRYANRNQKRKRDQPDDRAWQRNREEARARKQAWGRDRDDDRDRTRSWDRDRDRNDTRSPDRGHKPSGRRRRSRPDSPGDTRAARRKGLQPGAPERRPGGPNRSGPRRDAPTDRGAHGTRTSGDRSKRTGRAERGTAWADDDGWERSAPPAKPTGRKKPTGSGPKAKPSGRSGSAKKKSSKKRSGKAGPGRPGPGVKKSKTKKTSAPGRKGPGSKPPRRSGPGVKGPRRGDGSARGGPATGRR